MEPFNESGLRFTPPTQVCFRFSDGPTYKRLCGRAISEMDVCWWDEAKQTLFLLELKDYSAREPARELLPKLVAKGRDCLVMLNAACGEGSDAARQLRSELPEACGRRQKLRFFFVLKVGSEGLTREALNPMKDKLENDIKAYAELLGFGAVVVLLLDHATAIAKKLPLAIA